jgi:hypothetical protein
MDPAPEHHVSIFWPCQFVASQSNDREFFEIYDNLQLSGLRHFPHRCNSPPLFNKTEV